MKTYGSYEHFPYYFTAHFHAPNGARYGEIECGLDIVLLETSPSGWVRGDYFVVDVNGDHIPVSHLGRDWAWHSGVYDAIDRAFHGADYDHHRAAIRDLVQVHKPREAA